MRKRTGPSNPILRFLIDSIRRNSIEKYPFWEDISKKLSKSTRSRVQVNISKINRNSKDGQTIIVPGVVMSSGNLNKKIKIAAWRFTKEAKRKISNTGSKIMTIEELKKENPKGTDVKIMV